MIDLNCDMGESFGNYNLGCDAEVIRHITSANVACGFHASDPLVMERTVILAREHGVGVGAHPGYPDLRGFGRRRMECSADELRTDLLYQVGALAAIARAN
ncbi:MAG: LamB/YcsF family protein, partial [Desulfarculus sp.]|nr:LamB/YcsF family protein [Desulfarculus sp.]